MINLVLTILAIALTAGTLYASVNYLPIARPAFELTKGLTSGGFTSLETGWKNWKTDHAEVPLAANPDTWAGQLTPAYLFYPRAPKNFTWSYGQQGSGYYFCLSGPSNAIQYQAFTSLIQSFSPQQYFISTESCGALVTSVAPANWPTNLYVTYWVSP
jgi:hypothetical protein